MHLKLSKLSAFAFVSEYHVITLSRSIWAPVDIHNINHISYVLFYFTIKSTYPTPVISELSRIRTLN